MTDTTIGAIDAIEARRTTNLFDPTRGIDDAQIQELVRLATTAPTSFNLQNWRFIAVRTPEAKARLRQLAWDQAKVTDAAVTFIVIGQMADHRVLPERLAPAVAAGFMPAAMVPGWEGAAKSLYHEQPQRQRDEAVRTATFGAGTLVHAAQAMGLGTAPMIGFDAPAVAEAFGLAADELPVLLLAVGHAAPENWPRKPRRPLAQVLSLV
jgi:nitroreductase